MSVVTEDYWGTPVSTKMGELLSSDMLIQQINLLSHLVGYSRNYVFGEYSVYFLLAVAYSN